MIAGWLHLILAGKCLDCRSERLALQVATHINRLKMLKRQMYGRAKIDLLERRFLLAICG
jgi:hypothetical protein